MSPNPMRCTWASGAVVALALVVSPATFAAEQAGAPDAAPVVQDPAIERGVRQAAAEGPEALRRYTWRTRMIYNFYYNDFAPRQ